MVSLLEILPQTNNNDDARLQEQKRNFESFREESIYLLSIAIHQGIGTRKFDWKYLGLKPATVESLIENNISPPTIKVFAGLNKKATKLNSIKERIQRKYMVYAQPYWFVRECDLEKASVEIQELRRTCDSFRNQALNEYELERDAYLQKVKNVCQTAGLTNDDLELAIAHYLSYFPSREKVIRDFRVEFSGPVRIPSIREQMEQDAILAESQNRLNEANIIAQLQAEHSRNIRAKFQEAMSEAKDEIYGILAEQLSKLESIGNNEINNRTRSTLEKAIERMSILLGYEGGLQRVAQNFASIVKSSQHLDQRNVMLTQIANLKEQLKDEVDLLTFEGKGHRALAQWML